MRHNKRSENGNKENDFLKMRNISNCIARKHVQFSKLGAYFPSISPLAIHYPLLFLELQTRPSQALVFVLALPQSTNCSRW